MLLLNSWRHIKRSFRLLLAFRLLLMESATDETAFTTESVGVTMENVE